MGEVGQTGQLQTCTNAYKQGTLPTFFEGCDRGIVRCFGGRVEAAVRS